MWLHTLTTACKFYLLKDDLKNKKMSIRLMALTDLYIVYCFLGGVNYVIEE